jgi:hypothetical protein
MTDELALTPTKENFQGIPVRIVNVNGKDMIPVVDIARSLKIDRSNLSKTLKKNKALLAQHQGVVKITTPHGAQKMVCISEFGAIGLLYKISPSESEDKEVENRILAFQNWATELIKKNMQVQSKVVKDDPGEGWSSVAVEHLNFAKSLANSNPHLDPSMCLAIGIKKAEEATGMDLSSYKKLIPPSPAQFQEEYIDATHIGRIVNKTAVEVNRYLERMGYVYRGDDHVLYLTEKGTAYGKVFPGCFRSGHDGYYIRWRRAIITDAKMRENSVHRIE